MKSLLAVVGALAVGGSVLAAATAAPRPPTPEAAPAPPRGQQVFQRKNCGHCHSLAAAGLERTGDDVKMHGPDLSEIGLRSDAEDLAAYLRKGGRVAGRRHWKSFWGEEGDLLALAAWLAEFGGVGASGSAAAARPEPTPAPTPRP